MNNKTILYIVSAVFFVVSLITIFNWFPRPGWKTTRATSLSRPQVEFYVGNDRVVASVPDNRTRPEVVWHESIEIQYNPKNPQQATLAPGKRNYLTTITLVTIGAILMYYAKS